MTVAPISPELGLYLIATVPVVWTLLSLFARANREGRG